MNTDLVTLVRQQKDLARRNQTVRNGTFLLGILIGLAASVVWLVLVPTEGPRNQNKILIGVVGGALLGSLLLVTCEAALFRLKASCPNCGHSWEIKEGRTVPAMAQMPNWDKCPGCGLRMNEVLLAKHL